MIGGVGFFIYKDLIKGPRTSKSISWFFADILGTAFVSYQANDMYKRRYIDPTRKEIVDVYIPMLMRMKP